MAEDYFHAYVTSYEFYFSGKKCLFLKHYRLRYSEIHRRLVRLSNGNRITVIRAQREKNIETEKV